MSTLRMGAEGHLVRHTQDLLNHNRFGQQFIGRKKITGRYGPETVLAVRRCKHLLGYPKGKVNGMAGNQLRRYLKAADKLPVAYRTRRRARLFREAIMSRQKRALHIALSQVGYIEGPNNSNKFGAWFGFNFVAWCAEFQSFCATHAGLFLHSASCPQILGWARNRENGLRVVDDPRPGDYLLYDWEGDGVADHIGILEKVVGRGLYATVEGNTAPANNSNGGMVMRRTRTRNQVIAFVRATKVIPPEAL